MKIMNIPYHDMPIQIYCRGIAAYIHSNGTLSERRVGASVRYSFNDRKLIKPKKVSASHLGDNIASENRQMITHQLLMRCCNSNQSRCGRSFLRRR